MFRWPVLLALYGILNAAAYSCLVPLWEGWDEAYHYAYLQFLSSKATVPALGRSTLTKEIWHSLEIAPVSHYIQPFTKAPLNFAEYFALSIAERENRQAQLQTLPASEKYESQPDKLNYEANQAPLPYLVLAPIDFLLTELPLTSRILILRLVISFATVLLIVHSGFLLSRQLLVPHGYTCAALFCVFSSQMLYATICHVCNDWLAVPVMTYLLCASIATYQRGSARDCLRLGLILSAALLIKAYFLFMTPFAFGVVLLALWRKRATLRGLAHFLTPVAVLAGPWYLRNIVLYRNIGGTVEQTAGLGVLSFLNTLTTLPWVQSIAYMAHSSLWTGNNSFTAFSAITLDVVLAVLAVSLAFNLFYSRLRSAEWIVWAGAFVFCLGLAFVSITFFISSKGVAFSAPQWYMQVLLSPVLLMAFLGLSRARRFGRLVLRLFVCLWCYVLVATYLAKLGPMYGGYAESRTHVAELWRWYWSKGGEWSASLGDPAITWLFIGCTIALSLGLCVRLLFTPSGQ